MQTFHVMLLLNRNVLFTCSFTFSSFPPPTHSEVLPDRLELFTGIVVVLVGLPLCPHVVQRQSQHALWTHCARVRSLGKGRRGVRVEEGSEG